MLDLVETIFSRYGIQSLRYDGKMNREAREAVLARFRKAGGPRVILIRFVAQLLRALYGSADLASVPNVEVLG